MYVPDTKQTFDIGSKALYASAAVSRVDYGAQDVTVTATLFGGNSCVSKPFLPAS